MGVREGEFKFSRQTHRIFGCQNRKLMNGLNEWIGSWALECGFFISHKFHWSLAISSLLIIIGYCVKVNCIGWAWSSVVERYDAGPSIYVFCPFIFDYGRTRRRIEFRKWTMNCNLTICLRSADTCVCARAAQSANKQTNSTQMHEELETRKSFQRTKICNCMRAARMV